MTTVADHIMQSAVDHGIRHVFSVPGGHCQYLGEAADYHPDLEVIYTHHEQAAAVAALAYFNAIKTPAMCLVTAGPGVMNALTGVAAAWLDRVPMLVVSGQVKRDDLGNTVRPRFAPILPTVEIVRPFTAYAASLASWVAGNPMEYVLERMADGPVWVDVPLDCQIAEGLPAVTDRGETWNQTGAPE